MKLQPTATCCWVSQAVVVFLNLEFPGLKTRPHTLFFSSPTSPATDSANGDRSKLTHAAFKERDTELSRLAHELASAQEKHQHGTGQYIKAAVFGGLDGIITTFAVVASVTGANLPVGIVIIMVSSARRLCCACITGLTFLTIHSL